MKFDSGVFWLPFFYRCSIKNISNKNNGGSMLKLQKLAIKEVIKLIERVLTEIKEVRDDLNRSGSKSIGTCQRLAEAEMECADALDWLKVLTEDTKKG
jgi:hypothetical protein